MGLSHAYSSISLEANLADRAGLAVCRVQSGAHALLAHAQAGIFNDAQKRFAVEVTAGPQTSSSVVLLWVGERL